MKKLLSVMIPLFFLLTVSLFAEPGLNPPPGVVVDMSPDFQKVYLGSPSIAALPNGNYVASHDWFGRGTTNNSTTVLGSEDKGQTWKKLSDLQGQWWSNLFVHGNDLYIFGTTCEYGHLVIRRSRDGGNTWTEPKDSKSGLLLSGNYHTASCPVLVHDGRLWRAFEFVTNPKSWGNFEAQIGSVPLDGDFLDSSQWTFTNPVAFEKGNWKGTSFLEGNVLLSPQGEIVNILRVSYDGTVAALLHCSPDGKKLFAKPDDVMIEGFFGGTTKFTIRYDSKSGYYWTLACKTKDPEAYRNYLVLVRSKDLRHWEQRTVVFRHRDKIQHAWQYVDWLFEGENDLVFISRTGWDDSHKAHDANYLTFHRLKNFRDLTEKDDAPWIEIRANASQ